MIKDNDKMQLTNWEIVSVNPNDKKWNWIDLFCFWGSSVQSIIAFSLIASLYLVYELNFFCSIGWNFNWMFISLFFCKFNW